MTHIAVDYYLPAHRNPLHRYDYLKSGSVDFGPENYLQGTAVPIKQFFNSYDHDRERSRHFSDLHRSIFSLPEIAPQNRSFSPTFRRQKDKELILDNRKLSSANRSFPPRSDISLPQHLNRGEQVIKPNLKYDRLLNHAEIDEINIREQPCPEVLSSVDYVSSDDNESEKESDNITIHVFPNVGCNSALSPENISPTFSPTRKSTLPTKKNNKNSQIRKKQKDRKKEESKPTATRKARKESVPRRKRVNYAMLRKHDQENARRHPVRKQIFYSEALTIKLQKLIPKRIAGGKLKPTLKRSPDGEILVPSSPLEVRLDTLISTDSADPSPPPEASHLRWRENLSKFTNEGKKHKRKVRFRLPPETIGEERGIKRSNDVRDEETVKRIAEESFQSSEGSLLLNDEVKSPTEGSESLQSSEGSTSLVGEDVTLPNIFPTETDRNGVKRTNIDSVMYIDRKDVRKHPETDFQELSKKVENISLE